MAGDLGAVHPIAGVLGRHPGETVVPPPGTEPGYWAGAPSAVWRDGTIWLAYRLRRPVGDGRGYANVIARSEDGYHFETVAEVNSSQFGSASLERPALVAAPDGTWRLYVSCSTEGTKHWWVEMLTAPSPERFGGGRGSVVLPGDDVTAWKDPVVVPAGPGPKGDGTAEWRMWACRHDIANADEADRMESWYATSVDGEHWVLHRIALGPSEGTWDQRGARMTAVVPRGSGEGWLAFYDGRASAEENWEERTGVAISVGEAPDHFRALSGGPLVRHPSLRYVSPVATPDGAWFVYYELARDDGTHELQVQYAPAATAAPGSP